MGLPVGMVSADIVVRMLVDAAMKREDAGTLTLIRLNPEPEE